MSCETAVLALGVPRFEACSLSSQGPREMSSHSSLVAMNRVASGDNVAGFSTHRLKEEPPVLVPCCEGKELQIQEDLVHSGLSAISVKHDVTQCISITRAGEKLQIAPGLIKHRNSFRSLHRPDLKRVPCLRRMTPDELEVVFKGYAECAPQNDADRGGLRNDSTRAETKTEDSKQFVFHTDEPPTARRAEDVPSGMRLHGARARLYTSVLAGAKAGDHLDGISVSEECPPLEDLMSEDEVPMKEELQIIMPPRGDDPEPAASESSQIYT